MTQLPPNLSFLRTANTRISTRQFLLDTFYALDWPTPSPYLHSPKPFNNYHFNLLNNLYDICLDSLVIETTAVITDDWHHVSNAAFHFFNELHLHSNTSDVHPLILSIPNNLTIDELVSNVALQFFFICTASLHYPVHAIFPNTSTSTSITNSIISLIAINVPFHIHHNLHNSIIQRIH